MYSHNKHMYLKLCALTNTQKGGKVYDYYVVHSTTSSDSLLKILKDGYIRPGKDVKHSKIMSNEDLDYVYANINFDSINNISTIGGYKLFIHPKILDDVNYVFNTHWSGYPTTDSIVINNKTDRDIKFDQIKQYILNPTFYPKKLIENAGYRAHELLLDKIDLKKYLIGVQCEDCSSTEMKKLIKLLKKYPDTKIVYGERINNLMMPPKLSDLIDR